VVKHSYVGHKFIYVLLAFPKRMCSPGINGEGELRGNRLTHVHLEKMTVKTEC